MKKEKRVDVALSYASEHRAYIQQVAEELQKRGVTVFFDVFEELEMWGQILTDHFEEVFSKRARYVVCFLSREYQKKKWTEFERQHIVSSYVKRPGKLLLVSFDGVKKMKGIPDILYVVNASEKTPLALASMICSKIGKEEVKRAKTTDELFEEFKRRDIEKLKEKIENYNHQYVMVKVLKNRIHLSHMFCAKGAKIGALLRDAQEFVDRGEAEILPIKYVAVQFLTDQPPHKKGDLCPYPEEEAKKLKEKGALKRISTIDDLVVFS